MPWYIHKYIYIYICDIMSEMWTIGLILWMCVEKRFPVGGTFNGNSRSSVKLTCILWYPYNFMSHDFLFIGNMFKLKSNAKVCDFICCCFFFRHWGSFDAIWRRLKLVWKENEWLLKSLSATHNWFYFLCQLSHSIFFVDFWRFIFFSEPLQIKIMSNSQ